MSFNPASPFDDLAPADLQRPLQGGDKTAIAVSAHHARIGGDGGSVFPVRSETHPTHRIFVFLERQMDFDHIKRENLVHSLRDALPLPARPRPALLVFLRARGVIGRSAPKLVIVDIFNTAAQDLMCRFMIAGDAASSFVAPLAQIAFDRRHPLVQRLAARRRNAPRSRIRER